MFVEENPGKNANIDSVLIGLEGDRAIAYLRVAPSRGCAAEC